MPDDPPRRLITASSMWVVRGGRNGCLLRMLADGSVVVDARNGRIGLRLELNPQPLPPDEPDEPDEPA